LLSLIPKGLNTNNSEEDPPYATLKGLNGTK